MKTRKLKVRLGYYDLPASAERQRHSPHAPTPPVPFILLKGYWLEQANFHIDTPVEVCVRENQLIVTVAAGPADAVGSAPA